MGLKVCNAKLAFANLLQAIRIEINFISILVLAKKTHKLMVGLRTLSAQLCVQTNTTDA